MVVFAKNNDIYLNKAKAYIPLNRLIISE